MSVLPEVRDELMATATRRAMAAAAGPRPGLRFGRGGIGVALSAGIAVAVVVVAVLALRERAPAPAGSGRGDGSSLAALEAKLAVLRRPQTATDLSYPRDLHALGAIGPRLTRLAATTTVPGVGSVRVYLFVRKLSARQAPPALRSGLVTAVAVAGRDRVVGLANALIPAALRPTVLGSAVPGLRPGRPLFSVVVAIVPDGVARVRWTFTGAGPGILHPRPVTVYAPVENNIAVAPTREGEGPLASAVWYSADGKALASATLSAETRRVLRAIKAVNASRSLPISPVLVAHYRLFRTVPADNLVHDPAFPAPDISQGLNYWQTRFVGSLTGLDGRGIWVTPGRRWLCVTDPRAGDCGPLTHVATGFIGGSTSNGRETTWAGLVPDGNATITIVLANGARKTFPVIDNVYEVTVRGRVVAIINRDINGRIVRTPFG